jgi:hypothetical protein
MVENYTVEKWVTDSPKHFDEITSLFSAKCPFGKMSVRQNVRSAKCLFGKMSFGYLQKYGPSPSRVYCIFAKSTNSNFQFTHCSSHGLLTFLKRCYWLVGQKYNTHVTVKDHIYYLWINVDYTGCPKKPENYWNHLLLKLNALPKSWT